MEPNRYYRRGFGRRDDVSPVLEKDYRSALVDWMIANGHCLAFPGTEIVLAKEFGFCYGVDRAVEYAYATRSQFPSKRIFITGEIIHNPWVNRRLAEMGIEKLPSHADRPDRLAGITPEDVVIIPAFGIEQDDLERLREIGAILVDTTCGSVLNVWKSVARYARDGHTSIIHGKADHEETRATCSQVALRGGRYIVVRDLEETRLVCDAIEGIADSAVVAARFADAASPGFDPGRDLARIGLANQTTMLSSESLRIAAMLRSSMERRYGPGAIDDRFASFETICSATQDRQDAVAAILDDGLDLLVVIGGFNSSNTGHLVEIGCERTSTYHVQGAEDLISSRWIRHKPIGDPDPVVEGGWMPPGATRIGVSAGASTPNWEIGRVIERLLDYRDVPHSSLVDLIEGAEGA